MFFIGHITSEKSINLLEFNFIRKKGIAYRCSEKPDFHTINRAQTVQKLNVLFTVTVM